MATRKRQPDYLITKRRQEEDAIAIMTKTSKTYSLLKEISQFEESTTAKINHKHFLHRFEALKSQEVVKLDEKRERLRHLFEEDEVRDRAALLQIEGSNESRIQTMRNRMHELREAREKHRLSIVEEKLDQQWRQNCDELRSLQSKVLVKNVDAGRAIQLREREERKEADQKEKEHYERLWEQERLKKIDREVKDHTLRQQRNQETVKVLKDQLISFKEQAKVHQELKAEEARLMRHDAQMRLLEDQRTRERKEMEKRAVRLDLDGFNKAKIQQRQDDMRNALESDIRILSEVAKLEAEEKKAHSRRRVELHHEMAMYRQHLASERAKLIEREKEADSFAAAEQDRIWVVRADKWKKEQAARDRLMKEVLAGRQAQLQESIEKNRNAQEECRQQKLEIEKQIEQSKIQEKKEREKNHAFRENYSRALEDQIHDIEQRKAAERQAQQDEFDKEKSDYIAYEKRLHDGLEKARKQFEISTGLS